MWFHPVRNQPAPRNISASSSAISLQPAFGNNSPVTSASWIAKSSFNVISSCSSWSVRYSDASAGVLMYSYYSTFSRWLHWTCGLLSGYALSYHGTVPACGHSFGHFFCCLSFTSGSFCPLPDSCFLNCRKKCQHRNSIIGQCTFLSFQDSFRQGIQSFHKFLLGTIIFF